MRVAASTLFPDGRMKKQHGGYVGVVLEVTDWG